MQRYRYTGPDAARDLAISGGVIRFPRMEWVDPVAVAEASGIGTHHLPIILRGLGEDWEAEGPKKAARTRKANARKAKATQDEPAQPATSDDDSATEPTNPAEPDEEQA